jgi:hypothetical protein
LLAALEVFATSAVALSAESDGAGGGAARLPNCGITSVMGLAQVLGTALQPEVVKGAVERFNTETVSLADVIDIARCFAIPLVGVEATWQELSELDVPAILHCSRPDHFLTVVDIRPDWTRVVSFERNAIDLIATTELASRYTGQALIQEGAGEGAAPRAYVLMPHHVTRGAHLGQKLDAEFQVFNRGQEPLDLKVVKTSCTCTAAVVGDGATPPGGTATVSVKMEVTEVGSVAQMVTVQTNDPWRPLLQLTLRAEVPQDVRFVPQEIRLRTTKGVAAQQTLTVVGPPGTLLNQIEDESGQLEVRVLRRDETEDRVRYELEVQAPATVPVGVTASTLRLKTNVAEHTDVEVPVSLTVAGDLECWPPRVVFEIVQMGRAAKATVKVRSRSGSPFRLRAVECVDQRLRVTLPQAGDAGAVDIAVVEAAGAGLIDTVVRVQTDVPGEEWLSIPVTVLVQR